MIQIIVGGLIGFVGSLIAGCLTSDNAKGSTNWKRITAFGVGACVFYSFLAVAFFTGRKLIDNDLRHLARELIKETFVIGVVVMGNPGIATKMPYEDIKAERERAQRDFDAVEAAKQLGE